MSDTTRGQLEPVDVETGPDPETGPPPDVETGGSFETGRDTATGPDVESGPEPDSREPHLQPEPLAMTVEDVLHALDPRRWLPESRREHEREEEEDEYPRIKADWPAPFG